MGKKGVVMGLTRIIIEREGQNSFMTEMDCSYVNDKNKGDDSDNLSFLLNEALSAVFGVEADLFTIYELLIETICHHRPRHKEFLEVDSLIEFFEKLNKAWHSWEDDINFQEHFIKTINETT